MAGLHLDEWQQWILRHSLGETADGKWAAREVGLMVSRQNGKGALLEARELAGLFILEEELIVHTAHLQDTAGSHFRRLTRRIEDTPELAARLSKPGGILRGHGNESITLSRNPETGRQPRLEIRTRTGTGGLGFSISCLVWDEAMIISDEMHQALLPALSAMPNCQSWYTGSAPDEDNPSHQGVPFAKIREKGLNGSPKTAWFEWSLDYDDPARCRDVTDEELAAVNPGLGIRLDLAYIRETEQESLSQRGFAVQRSGVGAWPRTDGLDDVVITPEMWDACEDRDSKRAGTVCFAVDASPDRKWASISVAGDREDGLAHVEMVDRRHGTGWVVDRLVELVKGKPTTAVVVDGLSPAGSLIEEMTTALRKQQLLAGLHEQQVTMVGAREHAQACGMFYDAVDQQTLRHIGQPEMDEACRSAIKRPLVDSWAWSRSKSGGDISPLVAGTLAYWANQNFRKREAKLYV